MDKFRYIFYIFVTVNKSHKNSTTINILLSLLTLYDFSLALPNPSVPIKDLHLKIAHKYLR